MLNRPTSSNYSTGSTMGEPNVVKNLRELYLRSKNHPDLPIDRNLYRMVCDRELLLIAYQNLRSKPGQMTPGMDLETLDGISDE